MSNTEHIVKFVTTARMEDAPASAPVAARLGIFDCVGVALAGARQPAGRIGAEWARNCKGSPKSTIWGHDFKTSPHDAALVNGTAAHALDFDDVTWGLIGHPSVSLIASLLPLGEAIGASGRDVLHAYMVGFEVMAKIGRTTQPKHSLIGGWHPTSSIGSFGAAAACCRLLGLSGDETARALGMILSMTSGNVINFGTMTKPFHAGLAARNAVEAAQWSALGFTANREPFDGHRSFNNTYSRDLPVDMAPLAELGKVYELDVRGVVIKPYPCGVASHPAIDAAIEMRDEEGVRAQDVERIEIGVTRYTYDKLSYAQPGTELEGKFSMAYPVARALIDGAVTLASFTDEAVKDEGVVALIKRMEMYEDAEIERDWQGGSRPCRVRLHLKGGRTLEKLVKISKGNPEIPLSQEELRAKFRDCAQLSLDDDAIERAIDMLENLDRLASITELTGVLAGSAGAAARVSA